MITKKTKEEIEIEKAVLRIEQANMKTVKMLSLANDQLKQAANNLQKIIDKKSKIIDANDFKLI